MVLGVENRAISINASVKAPNIEYNKNIKQSYKWGACGHAVNFSKKLNYDVEQQNIHRWV